LKPENAAPHNNLGLSYFERKDFEDALIEFGKAINVDDCALYLNNRGLAYYNLVQLVKA
jgi:tetratricopeptide (TPR) repeat protein